MMKLVSVKKNLFVSVVVAFFLSGFAMSDCAAGPEMKISTDFPGGNAIVKKNQDGVVVIEPDLRGGRPWFYWSIEVEVVKPGKVKFYLGKAPRLSARGPAVSFDGGKSWRWMGVENCEFSIQSLDKKSKVRVDAFYYDFRKKGEKIRFCVTIPYQQRDLDIFLDKIKNNKHLTQSVLTKTRKGKPVELLRIGEPGPGKRSVFVSCRHHACESVASYTFEGFLSEALADTPAGRRFRRKYVLYAVPMVDKDGVEAGDQGKNRNPHDHNRDYMEKSIYPEVRAIKALISEKKIQMVLDFHDPLIRGESHTVFAFYGLKFPRNYENTVKLSRWMTEDGPQMIKRTVVWFKKSAKTIPTVGQPLASFYAYNKNNIISTTLETPYTVPDFNFDADMARAYGRSVLRAWSRVNFTIPGANDAKGIDTLAALKEFSGKFNKIYRSDPKAAEAMANKYLEDENAPPLYAVEANNLMGKLRLRQKKYNEAIKHYQAVVASSEATLAQRSTALSQLVIATCSKPDATPGDVEARLKAFRGLPYTSPQVEGRVYKRVSQFFETKKDYKKALVYAEKHESVASKYYKGRAMNKIASLMDSLGMNDAAIEVRKKAVAYLREQLDPVPPGVFGTTMGLDLLEALCGIPSSTLAEKKAAAEICYNHPVKLPWLIKKVQLIMRKTGEKK